jgi:hypothetical protein
MEAIQHLAVLSGAAQLGAVVNYSIAGKLKYPSRQIIHGTCTFFLYIVHERTRILDYGIQCKKKVATFPSLAGMSLTKLSLGGNN